MQRMQISFYKVWHTHTRTNHTIPSRRKPFFGKMHSTPLQKMQCPPWQCIPLEIYVIFLPSIPVHKRNVFWKRQFPFRKSSISWKRAAPFQTNTFSFQVCSIYIKERNTYQHLKATCPFKEAVLSTLAKFAVLPPLEVWRVSFKMIQYSFSRKWESLQMHSITFQW